MAISILINGAKGRMGQAAVKAIQEDSNFELLGTTSTENDFATVLKKTNPNVVIDFTNATALRLNLPLMIAAKTHPVIGTTGLTSAEIKKFQIQCAKIKLGGIIAPNFSLGAVLLMKHAQAMAQYFSHVEIIEMHHDGKIDSPSGTALRTAEMLAANFKPAPALQKTHETIAGARGARHHEIPIHAIRLPGLVAHEQVIFGSKGETLTLRHDSIDRVAFMPGLCLACKQVIALKELVYGLENIL